MGKKFLESVIPRLDRGIQLFRGRLPLDPAVKPRDDNGGELFFKVAVCLALSPCVWGQTPLRPQESFPSLTTLGILPPQLDTSRGDSEGLDNAFEALSTAFSAALRESGRFFVLDDELVASQWDSLSGRTQLVADYEISAFASLLLVPTENAVMIMARLLSPNLEIYLQELDTVARSSLATEDVEELGTRSRLLAFRLLNLLPIDVSVTSVQGKHITLSGGTSQFVKVGDELRIIRPTIRRIHPATHAWVDFHTELVGIAKVIESEETSSVAELTKLVRKNDIRIGDGVKVSKVVNRALFQDESLPAFEDELVDEEKEPVIVVKPRPTPPALSKIEEDEKPAPLASKTPDETSEEKEETSLLDSATSTITSMGGAVQKGFGKYVEKLAKTFYLTLSQAGWSFVGTESSGTKVVWYFPLNLVAMDIDQHLFSHVHYGYGFNLGAGKTRPGGGYSSYDLHGRAYWEDEFPLFGRYIMGLHLGYASLNVKKEAFGGISHFNTSVILGMKGDLKPIWLLEVFGELRLTPLHIGSITYTGTSKGIASGFEYGVELGSMITPPDPEELQVGLSFSIINAKFSDADGQAAKQSKYAFNIVMRRQY
ncbi:MAG: hypothetical protein HYW48_07670 [Deltaproteobacteria bacterium]|nr:hypothetical protein [Deltaproteobacteria bacterium]